MSDITFIVRARVDMSDRQWRACVRECRAACANDRHCTTFFTGTHVQTALDHATHVLEGEHHGKLVGFAWLELLNNNTKEMHLSTLYAVNSGTVFMNAIRNLCQQMGCKWLTVDATVSSAGWYWRQGLYFCTAQSKRRVPGVQEKVMGVLTDPRLASENDEDIYVRALAELGVQTYDTELETLSMCWRL